MNAGVGVALNDAYSSVVEMNTLRDCGLGVGFVKHFDDAEFNVNNSVRANLVIGCRRGVDVQSGVIGNRIVGNRFAGMDQKLWVRQEGGNEAADNALAH